MRVEVQVSSPEGSGSDGGRERGGQVAFRASERLVAAFYADLLSGRTDTNDREWCEVYIDEPSQAGPLGAAVLTDQVAEPAGVFIVHADPAGHPFGLFMERSLA
jgi:hypothetical protein